MSRLRARAEKSRRCAVIPLNVGFIMYERPIGIMQPTRRRCLAIAGAGLGAGVAGCLSSGSNVTYPEADESTNESTDGSSDSGDTDEEPADPLNSRLAEETAPIYTELRWFE